MKLIGIVRLGRDAEVRYTPSGAVVCEFSAAYDHGPKPAEGHRAVQWIDLKLWGDRGDRLAQYLVKGQAVLITADDVHVEAYAGRDGTPKSRFVARVIDVEFAGPRPLADGAAAPPPASAAPKPQRAPGVSPGAMRAAVPPETRQRTGTGFDDMDDDIPF